MKHILPLLAIILTTTAAAQVRPYAGIGGGWMENTQQISAELKVGTMIGNASIEASAAFSQYVPFQHSIRVGYQLGEKLYLTPQAGRLWHFYGNGKESASRWSYGAEIGYIFNMDGTNGEGMDVRLTLGYFGNYGGLGFRVGF